MLEGFVGDRSNAPSLPPYARAVEAEALPDARLYLSIRSTVLWPHPITCHHFHGLRLHHTGSAPSVEFHDAAGFTYVTDCCFDQRLASAHQVTPKHWKWSTWRSGSYRGETFIHK
jgi:hypothetical protein